MGADNLGCHKEGKCDAVIGGDHVSMGKFARYNALAGTRTVLSPVHFPY